jgi:hypothetical protein
MGIPIPNTDGAIASRELDTLLTCPSAPACASRASPIRIRISCASLEHHDLKPGQAVEVARARHGRRFRPVARPPQSNRHDRHTRRQLLVEVEHDWRRELQD